MSAPVLDRSAAVERQDGLLRARQLVEQRFGDRVVILSPPRSGSTPVARMLWQSPAFSQGYHCHEPFEARYWGGQGDDTVLRSVLCPMHVVSGERVDAGTLAGRPSLVLKEMCFQLDTPAFDWLTVVATRPIVFVMRDPRLSIVSRLRIVKELDGSTTFPPEHSGWDALAGQVARCRERQTPYVIVDSQRLRRAPDQQAQALLERLGLQPMTSITGITHWQQRTGLQLCSPEVGALMSEVRTGSDPFYRRVLTSTGIQPPDAIDDEGLDQQIHEAGLTARSAQWQDAYRLLQQDPNML